MRQHLVTIVSMLVILTMSEWGQAQDRPGNPLHGETIYKQHCLRCHGVNGKGDGPDASSLIVKPTNFHSSNSRAKTDIELRSIIVWGVVFSPMHGWWDRLSGGEMRDVISYIRRMAPFQPNT